MDILSIQIAKAMQSIRGWGLHAQNKLINEHGSLKNILEYFLNHSYQQVYPKELEFLKKLEAIHDSGLYQDHLDRYEKEAINVITIDHIDYPALLRMIPDAPLILYFKGQMPNIMYKQLGIVGTRRASEYGKNALNEFLLYFKGMEINIVSGLAEGIDGIAHQAALKNNLPTYAVLGHGLQTIFPSHHQFLSQKIIEEGGGIISEFDWGIYADKANFPLRNRIVAGMSELLWIVETPSKGGSMITAQLAQDYQRDLLTLPGSIFQNNFKGNHQLLKNQAAYIITEPNDILAHLRLIQVPKTPKYQQKKMFEQLSEAEQDIVNILHLKGRMHIDDIAIYHSFSMSQVAHLLLNLEMNGLVKTIPGKMYELL